MVLPVKPLSVAKSRLGPGAGHSLEPLALALFQDTATAVLACPSVGSVIVVTRDDRVAAWATDHRCRAVDDSRHPGINAAARWGAGFAAEESGIAVLVSDLPCLSAAALDAVLALGEGHDLSFLADADGTGTTMWLAAAGQPVEPRFGPQSRAAHRAAGHADLVDDAAADPALLARARRDVDTQADLAAAARLGLGSATAAALAQRPAGDR